jgi:hypothetical protein
MPLPKLTGIKPTFSGGEFAPDLYSRIDLDKYRTGARTLRNFIVHPHGGASNRPGLKYIATGKTAGKKIRLIPFEFSTTQTYVLEFGEKYIRFLKDDVPITISATDPYTKLLLHCDGVDEATTFTDECGKTVTPAGTAQIDTAQKVFGTGSCLLDGDSDYLSVAHSADFHFDADFDIEARIRLAALPSATDAVICSQITDANNYFRFLINQDPAGVYNLYYQFANAGTVYTNSVVWSPIPAINTWYHIRLARSGNNIYFFVNGQQMGTTIVQVKFPVDYTGALRIGNYDTSYLNGWIEEFRISKGIARATADFSLPLSAYVIVNGDAAAWVTSTGYAIGDFVTNGTTVYICLLAHTSGTFADDLAADKWVAQTIYEIATPYVEADLKDLNYTQSADVLFITHPNYASRQLERNADADWNLNLYDYQGGPFQLANADSTDTLAISAVTGTGKTLTASGFTFSSLHVESLWELTHYIEGQAVSAALDAAAEVSTSIKCGGTWRFISHGTWTGTIRIEKSTTNAFGGEETMLREFSSADDFNANTYGTEDMSDNAEPFYIRIKMTARTSGICNINLSSDPFNQKGIVKITAVAADGVTATADVKRTCGGTGATADWAEGSWSPYRGWPTVVEFHPEDRLVFGNTRYEPSTYWMTKSGNYYDFSKSSPLVDSDGISSPLPSRKVNGINGFVSLGEMIAFTLSNECSIRSSSGPLSPTTAYNKIHGYEGSYGVRPVVVGNRVIYVQSTGAVVRDLGYVWSSESFEGSDITIFSKHLFTDHTIVEMAYQQNPDRLVWAVRSDGKLLSMTYMREQEVIAWTWHDTNDGTDLFESVCCKRGDGYDEVWFSVNRGGTRYIEKMVRRMASTALADQFFVDCGITQAENLLLDNFNDNSIDAEKWTTYLTGDGAIAEINNEIELTATTGGFSQLLSQKAYDFTGSTSTIKLVDAGNQALTYTSFQWQLAIDNTNKIRIYVINGIIYFGYKTTAGGTVAVAQATYIPDTHKYLRMREASGTTYWDYSADGISWVNACSLANPIAVTALRVWIDLYTNNTVATTAKVDDFQFISPVTTISGLSHLANKAVSILADGVEVTGKTVSAAGVLTLTTAASKVQVGLAYKSDLETLNIDANLQDGTAQGRMVKISRLVLRVLNTAGGYIGLDTSNLYAITYDRQVGYVAGALFSGDLKETAGLCYQDGGRIFFRQTSPLPVTITGLIPEITIGGMSSK